MTDFKKGYWNLEELKIVEWINKNQNGFMEQDVISCRNRLLEDVSFYSESSEEYETGILPKDTVINLIRKIFGDM